MHGLKDDGSPAPTWPTKICGPNLVEVLNAAGFYQKKEWVGLTHQEIFEIENGVPDNVISDRDWTVYFAKAIEAKLKEKNGG
jgi:hypothetical protein